MKVRSARPQVRRLAESLGLDYPGMESDRFWLAEEDGRAQGIVGLMKHLDCLELVALGVAPQARSRGLGGKLIEALSAEAQEDVFLATVVPGFFEKHAFVRAERAPVGLK